MSEFESTQPPQPHVTDAQARKWVAYVDQLGLLDRSFTLGQGPQAETVQLYDAVIMRDQKDNTTEPIVVVKKGNGSSEEMPARRFLELTNLIPSFEDSLGAKAVREQKQAEAEQIADDRIKQAQQRHWQEDLEAQAAQLFMPLIRPENELKHPGYSHLVNPTEQEKYDTYSEAVREVRKKQEHFDKFVNPESRQHAEEQLRQTMEIDDVLSDIVADYCRKTGVTEMSGIVDAIRTDPDLRIRVGKHFLEKVDKVSRIKSERMPERVLRNGGKNPNSLVETDYGMTNREWVALLCVAKIDGSFSKAQEDPYASFNDSGVAIVGQHRFAADLVLHTSVET